MYMYILYERGSEIMRSLWKWFDQSKYCNGHELGERSFIHFLHDFIVGLWQWSVKTAKMLHINQFFIIHKYLAYNNNTVYVTCANKYLKGTCSYTSKYILLWKSPLLGRNRKTKYQEEMLMNSFRTNPYLGKEEKCKLAKSLSISENEVQRWFYNKHRRTHVPQMEMLEKGE